MKPKTKLYSLALAFWMCCILLLQSAHQFGLLDHTHQNCDAQHEKHHYPQDCGICDFYFHASILTPTILVPLLQELAHYSTPPAQYTPYSSWQKDFCALRAPPHTY